MAHANALTTKEAAEYLGLSQSSLRQARMNGRRMNRIPPPPFIRVGRKILYLVADLDHYLAAHRVECRPKASR